MLGFSVLGVGRGKFFCGMGGGRRGAWSRVRGLNTCGWGTVRLWGGIGLVLTYYMVDIVLYSTKLILLLGLRYIM